MKLNNWSIVPSPTGISAKPLAQHNDIEVCVSITGNKLRIGVHRDGQHAALRVFKMDIKPRTPMKPRPYKPRQDPKVIRKVCLVQAKWHFNKGNEQMMWLYLLGAEFYEGGYA